MGDSFSIGPSAINGFRNWPFLKARNSEIAYDPLVSFHHINGERFAGPKDFSKMLYSEDAARVFRHSRPRFHSMLLEQLQQIGIEVEYDCEVQEYFEEAEHSRAGVVLRDGSQVSGSLVVAADGLRSKSWPLVAGKEVPARSSGDALFRVAYPVELALADPKVAEHFQLLEDGRSIIQLWRGAGVQAAFWRNQHEMSWSLSHSDDGKAQESWSARVSPSDVMRYTSTIPGWPEIANRVIRTTPSDAIVDWRLMWRDPQPKWTSPGGRVIQLGDAAHAFLPNSGNGGTQAMEDAISLATCIAIASDSQTVPIATRVHNLLCFERVSCLQAFGVVNREKAQGKSCDRGDQTSKNVVKEKDAQVGQWILRHDPAQYALDKYHQVTKHLQDGIPFKNTNVPPGMCDGQRPRCAKCADRGLECVYAAEPDAPPITALKRKHDALLRENTEVNQLLSHLQSVAQLDALRILDYLREGHDVSSTIGFAQTLPAPGAPAEQLISAFRDQNVSEGSLTSVPYGGFSGLSSVALDLNGGRDRYDRITTRPENSITIDSATTLPSMPALLASLREPLRSSSSIKRRTRMRRSPSAPNLQQVQTSTSKHRKSPNIWLYDDRLANVRAQDWNVTYVDDAGFRNIISSFFVWDHPAIHMFDEDDFLDGLIKLPSDTCSEVLVHSVLAYGSVNYAHVDRGTAENVLKAAWSEAERLWDTPINREHDLASGAAAMVIWALHTFNGADKLGMSYLSEMRHITTNLGLYDKHRRSEVYDPAHPRRSQARAVFAWGMHDWAVFAEVAFRADLGFKDEPPVPPPRVINMSEHEQWMPWPWPKQGRTVPALRYEVFAAQAGFATIFKRMVPLQRKHSSGSLTLDYLTASLDLYQQFRVWWDSIDSILKSFKFLEEAPPHVFQVICLYHFAIVELFRPFTMTSAHPTPHAAPLIRAMLPVEPCLSIAIDSAVQARALQSRFAKLYSRDQFMNFFPYYALPVAFETLPSISSLSPTFSYHAASAFLDALRILFHASKQLPIVQYAAMGIEQAASTMNVILPDEAKAIFQDLKRRVAENNDRDRGKSNWVVVFNTATTNVQASRLDNLVRELNNLNLAR
ncbi:hypothetical protein QM012_000011 [Aureobasidium pullulans]|uniref:FAD-binding domain-containing protein n=1 Tax=Aureobasidium pullulans TaxID=5580 RepID=A0ABR0TUL2_AURPU